MQDFQENEHAGRGQFWICTMILGIAFWYGVGRIVGLW